MDGVRCVVLPMGIERRFPTSLGDCHFMMVTLMIAAHVAINGDNDLARHHHLGVCVCVLSANMRLL